VFTELKLNVIEEIGFEYITVVRMSDFMRHSVEPSTPNTNSLINAVVRE